MTCLVGLTSWLLKSTVSPPRGHRVELQTHDPWDSEKSLIALFHRLKVIENDIEHH